MADENNAANPETPPSPPPAPEAKDQTPPANPELDALKKQIQDFENEKKTLSEQLKSYQQKEQDAAKAQEDSIKQKADNGDLAAQLELERKERAREQEELNKLKEKNQKTEAEAKNLKAKQLDTNVKSVLSRIAPNAHDMDDLLGQKQFSNILKIDPVTMMPSEESAKEFIKAVQDAKPHYFKQADQPSIDTTRPNSKGPAPIAPENMSYDQLKDKLKNQILGSKK